MRTIEASAEIKAILSALDSPEEYKTKLLAFMKHEHFLNAEDPWTSRLFWEKENG